MDEEEYSPDPPGLAMRREILQRQKRPRDIHAAHAAEFVKEHGSDALFAAKLESERRQEKIRLSKSGRRRNVV